MQMNYIFPCSYLNTVMSCYSVHFPSAYLYQLVCFMFECACVIRNGVCRVCAELSHVISCDLMCVIG